MNLSECAVRVRREATGTLEVGKLADLVVIEQDFLNCPEEELKSIAPVLTMVEGRTVYERKR